MRESAKVFISYSHDSPEHMDRVLALSDRLRQDGIDCHIDQYEMSPPEGWPRWTVNKVEWADFVLVLCTSVYRERFKGKAPPGQGKGVKWEGAILTQELYESEAMNTRFIPVVLSSKNTEYIPVILRGQTYYDPSTEKGYEALYRRLTDQPRILKPTLGRLKPMKPLNPVQDKEFIMTDIKKICLFLSSPGDVGTERAKVHTVVDQVNRMLGDNLGIVLEVIDWKTHTAPDMGRPQEVINQQVGNYNIFVGILWKRFGTPTGKAESGTEEEFNIAYANWLQFKRPRILFYFSQSPYMPKNSSDLTQWMKVMSFKEKLQQKGLFRDYENPEKFADLLREHLGKVLQEWFKPRKGSASRQIADFVPYMKYLCEETMYIDIRGLVTGKEKIHQFPIDELYIPLKSHYGAKADKRTFENMEGGQVLLQEALKEKRLFIKGDPGSGKTTFLRLIAYTLCKGRLGEATQSSLRFSEPLPLPLLIRVGTLSRYISQCTDRPDFACPCEKDSPRWLLHYLESLNDEFNLKLPGGAFRHELEQGRCMILLDGLDEAPDRQARAYLSRLAGNLVKAYPRCQVVLTSRPVALIEGSDRVPLNFEMVEIEQLDERGIEDFLSKWCSILYAGAPDKGGRYKKELRESLKHGQIKMMARTPVMLTALAVVHWNENRLPEQRAELYESVLTWLFRSRDEKEGRLKAERCRKVLQKLATAMFMHPEGRQRQVGLRYASESLQSEFKGTGEDELACAEKFLHTEMMDSGVIVEREHRVEFWHLSFHEYLAAYEIGGMSDERQIESLFKDMRLYESEWREVVLLLGGVLYKQGDDRINNLIDKIIEKGPKESNHKTLPELAKEVALLGGIVNDLSPYKFEPKNDRYKEIVRSVMGIFAKETFREIPVQVRIEAADALGRVGDPRFDLERNLWVDIPAGRFWMGAQRDNQKGRNYDRNAYVSESPVHEVELSAYQIGKYPVTVCRYKVFIEEGGYEDGRYWEAGGFGEFKEPDEWGKQLQYPTRPVVNVSWYEAKAYASWAGCGLPTEAQWERAARGPDEEYRKYPWGNEEPDKETINYRGNDINHPTPVGIFPESCSPEGVIDMAGNVWEWCEDWYGGYAYKLIVDPKRSDRGTVRVLRGGNWGGDGRDARSAYRYRDVPDYRDFIIGFRLVRGKK